jgi:hypothetical protein
MSGLLRSLYLGYFSQPRGLRPLYRLLCKRRKRQPIRKITELGVGPGDRTLRVLELCGPTDETAYTGIDLFEARQNGDGPGLSLKEAHKKLTTTGAKVRLIPGDPNSALTRSANALADQDLILISADQDRASLARAWFYVPRMLHESTIVLEEARLDGEITLKPISHEEIRQRAAAAKGRRAA